MRRNELVDDEPGLEVEVDRPSFFALLVGYDFGLGSFDVNGGAVVLLERRLFPVCGQRLGRPPLGLQLSEGVFRRERRRKGAAGASSIGSVRTMTRSTSTRASFFGRSLSTCTAARWGCWSINLCQVADRGIVDLNSGCNTQRE